MKTYWVSCEEYTYFRMPVDAENIFEAKKKAKQMINNDDHLKWKNENGDGDVEFKGFCDKNGFDVTYKEEGEDYYFWDE